MIDLTDINTLYLLCPAIWYLVAKLIVIRSVVKRVTVRKTRRITLVVAVLVSPTLLTLLFLLRANIDLILIAALAALPIDLALLNWVRVLFEPRSTLDDIEYDDTPGV